MAAVSHLILGKIRWTIRILDIIVVAWFVCYTLSEAFLCIPISANWDNSVKGHYANRWVVLIVGNLIWIITDFAVLLAPIPSLMKMQLPVQKKAGVVALFLTGSWYVPALSPFRTYLLPFSKLVTFWATSAMWACFVWLSRLKISSLSFIKVCVES